MTVHTSSIILSTEAIGLRPVQLAWLAAAVFVVSAGYGALMPLLPGWMTPMLPSATATEIARHIGFLSGVYSAGVLVGAPLWGVAADRVGPGRVLIIGLVGYVASLLLMLVPALTGLWGIYALRGTTGFFVTGSSAQTGVRHGTQANQWHASLCSTFAPSIPAQPAFV